MRGKLRDELRVKAHLGRLGAEKTWDDLETCWEHLDAKSIQLGRESGEAVDDVLAAGKLLAGELRNAYRDIKRRLIS